MFVASFMFHLSYLRYTPPHRFICLVTLFALTRALFVFPGRFGGRSALLELPSLLLNSFESGYTHTFIGITHASHSVLVVSALLGVVILFWTFRFFLGFVRSV